MSIDNPSLSGPTPEHSEITDLPSSPVPLGIFDSSTLAAQIRHVLATEAIPPTHTVAILTAVDKLGVRTIVSARINDHWTVEGLVDHRWSAGTPDASVTLKASW